jgi:ABC-2 type transport system permease protein
MPIHDQGYRHYGGQRALHGRAWWVIARAAILEQVRQRRFLGLMLFAWSLFVMRAVQLYVASTITQAAFLAPDEDTFRQFLLQQRVFTFFVTIFAGAGLIANDRAANALQIYLSKPLTRIEYISGKLVALALFLVAVTWVPAMLLVLLQIVFSGSITFITEHLLLIPAITLTSMLQVSLAALTMLALSSLSRSRRFVSMLYAGIVFFMAAMARALSVSTGARAWFLISPEDTLGFVTVAIFRRAVPPGVPIPLAVVVIAVLFAASIVVLERRVRAVEIV